nr:MAG TPA: hypothetical protein [Caudoviricetes sp.]
MLNITMTVSSITFLLKNGNKNRSRLSLRLSLR